MGTVCGFPFVTTEFLREYQYPLDVQKPMGPCELMPEYFKFNQVPKDLIYPSTIRFPA